MALRCVLAPDTEGMSPHALECPFGMGCENSSPGCPWRDDGDLCRYQADRRDLMKSLSLLSARVFELSKRNAIPAETMTGACLLLDSARTLMERSKPSECDGKKDECL